ncbi:cell division protein FtsQ/DivIB [Psychrobacter aestuarii]|uniref:Cell division protein FtsQ/DivIB n=2 Tax=Psychrobacter aestuarii TaxID=556327 RepID=A0ABP3FH19_9GAMM
MPQALSGHTIKYVFISALVLLLLLIVFMGTKRLQEAPPADVYIDASTLNTAQYQSLKQTVSHQQVGSFFNTDLQALRDVALRLSWVDEVSVSRDWQQGIVITALPKKAVAHFGTERLIDAKGAVFVPADGRELTNDSYATLQGESDKGPVIMQQMQQVNEWYEPLNMHVADIILTPRMTWVVRFDTGLRVIVDNESTAQKLIALRDALNHQLKDRRAEIQSVDLRYKNGFAIAWHSNAAS